MILVIIPVRGGFVLIQKAYLAFHVDVKNKFIIKRQTTTENNITTTNTIEDRRNMKFGSSRNVSPDVIFKPESALQHGSIEICDTGFGSNRITPEELDERLDKLETSVEEVKKDVDELRLQKIIISL